MYGSDTLMYGSEGVNKLYLEWLRHNNSIVTGLWVNIAVRRFCTFMAISRLKEALCPTFIEYLQGFFI